MHKTSKCFSIITSHLFVLLIEPLDYSEDEVGEAQPDSGIDNQCQLVGPPMPTKLIALELQELVAIGNTVVRALDLLYRKDTAYKQNKQTNKQTKSYFTSIIGEVGIFTSSRFRLLLL